MHADQLGPRVIAHRGASAYAPEHTFAAYDLALEQGAQALELDVRCAARGELVVRHDPLRTLRPGDPAPLTLDAVLGRYAGRTRWLVELKDPLPAWEDLAVDALERHGVADDATVQSFDTRAVRRLAAAHDGLAVAPLVWRRFARSRARRHDALASYARALHVWHGAVDAPLVLAAHDRGLTVSAWTVNDAAELDRLTALGVDGLITDVPDVARAAAERVAVVPAVA